MPASCITELVDYSLVQKGNPGALNPDSIIYYVHDIVLDYLKDTVSEGKQVKNFSITTHMYNVNTCICTRKGAVQYSNLRLHTHHLDDLCEISLC